MKTQIVQKAVVVNGDGQMLMLRRSKTDVRRPGQWDLPGGMRDGDEELIQAVTREITEETGLRVTRPRPVYAKTEVRTWKDETNEHTENIVFIFYTARTSQDNVKLSFEHDKFQWAPITKSVSQFEYYLHKELLQHILDNELL